MSLLALLPSPLLGCAMWEPVALALQDLGHRAQAVDISGAAPSTAQEALLAYVDALPRGEELVLVPHSNAGLYVAAIAQHRDVTAVVFVDAGLPPVKGGAAATLPLEFLALVAGKADAERILPVWTDWWQEHEVAELFSDAAVREAVERQQRGLPLSYFEDVVPVPPGWAALPCAYLAFGHGYDTEAETARQLDWPVRVLDGGHLEMTVRPRAVAELILILAGEATSGSRA